MTWRMASRQMHLRGRVARQARYLGIQHMTCVMQPAPGLPLQGAAGEWQVIFGMGGYRRAAAPALETIETDRLDTLLCGYMGFVLARRRRGPPPRGRASVGQVFRDFGLPQCADELFVHRYNTYQKWARRPEWYTQVVMAMIQDAELDVGAGRHNDGDDEGRLTDDAHMARADAQRLGHGAGHGGCCGVRHGHERWRAERSGGHRHAACGPTQSHEQREREVLRVASALVPGLSREGRYQLAP